MKTLIILLATTLPVWGGAYTASVTGNWADTATWGGSGPPVSGDTVTINNGVTVTIPVSTTAVVGASPTDDTGTPAIQCATASGTGILIVNGTLQFKGPIRQCNANWTVGPDAVVTHDSSGAAVPADANYTWSIGTTGGTLTNSKLLVGTAGHPAVFGVAVSSGNAGGFTNGGANSGRISGYANVSYWGTAAKNGLRAILADNTDSKVELTGTWDNCGPIYVSNIRGGAIVSLQGLKFTNPLGVGTWNSDVGGATLLAVGLYYAAAASGSGGVSIGNLTDLGGSFHTYSTVAATMTVENSIFRGTTTSKSLVMNPYVTATTWRNVLILNRIAGTGSPTLTPGGTLDDTLVLRTGGSGNPHYVSASARSDTTMRNWVYETLENGQAGDAIQIETNPAAAYTLTVTNNILLPGPDGLQGGSFVNITSATVTNITVAADHNSWLGGMPTDATTQGMAFEASAGKAGIFSSVRSNLMKGVSTVAYLVRPGTSPAPSDGAWTNVDYNLKIGHTGTGYEPTDAKFSTPSPPGTNDISVEPRLVDPYRTFLAWAQTVNPSLTTWTQAIDAISAGATANLTIAAAITWLRAGYVPQNPALWCTGHDGETFGAVPHCAKGKAFLGSLGVF